jgi:CO/xanthine dehydrogenase Mo-binding subunit
MTAATPSLIGQRVRRSDGTAKVTGEAIYGFDHVEAGMLHARLLRSPVAAGRITRLDTTRAQSMPGVHAVITAADAPGRSGWVVRDATLMAARMLRYIGEPIAAVAADTVEQAEAAVAAIELEIERLEAVTDVERALDEGVPLVHEDWAEHELLIPGGIREGNLAWQSVTEVGDVDEVFARADVRVFEDEYRVLRQHQCYIEPRGAVARYADGRFTIHTGTQFPFKVRDTVADYLQLRPSDVRVLSSTVGGGFGAKIDAYFDPICAALARKARRPVKYVNTRAEEFAAGNPRENGVVRIRTAVSADGELLAREADVLMDNGAASGELPLCAGLGVHALSSNYRIPNVRVTTRLVYTNTAPTGAFRGMLGTYTVFAHECHLDRIANELGEDRRAFRLRHVIRDGDALVTGQQLDDVAFVDGLERIEEIAPWPSAAERRPWRGVGMALASWITTPTPGGVVLKLIEDGRVGLVTAGSEIGTGAVATGITQVVAEEMGVRPEDVVVLAPDTDAAPFDGGAIGSRSVHMLGPAVQQAAGAVREQIFETAATLLEAAKEDLELVDGTVQVVGVPGKALGLAEVAQAALWTSGPISGTGRYQAAPIEHNPGCVVGNIMPTLNACTFHVHFAEVEVDPETGKVTILRYVVAQDVGRAINPTSIEGQIQGGVVQGVGYALYEGMRLQDGAVLDQSFESYRLPGATESPAVETIILEHPDPHGPYGAKGTAETPVIPVAAAIANAVADAIGRPITRLPMTPFDVLAAIREGQAEAADDSKPARTPAQDA